MFQHIEYNIDLLSRFFNFFSLVENKTYIKKNIPSSSSLTYLILSHRYWLDRIHTFVNIVYVSYFGDIYKEHIQNIHSYSVSPWSRLPQPSPALAAPPEFPVSVPAADTARARAAAAARSRSGTISCCLRWSQATDALTRTLALVLQKVPSEGL